MQYSALLAATCATLAAAAPTSCTGQPGSFDITNFSYGCTSGCYYSFDVTISGSAENHPAVGTSVHCAGSLDDNTNYVQCGNVSQTQSISAYIEKANNNLHLKYSTRNYNTGATYNYFGDDTVYAATSDKASLQQPNFSVPENRATGVA